MNYVYVWRTVATKERYLRASIAFTAAVAVAALAAGGCGGGGHHGGGVAPTTSSSASSIVLSKASGDNQTGPTGSFLPTPLTVLALDTAGAPVPNATVTYTSQTTNKTFTTQTDKNGTAAALYSPDVGVNTIDVRVTSPTQSNDVQFTETGTNSQPSSSLPNFAAGVAYAAPVLRDQLFAADMNKDGKVDLVAAGASNVLLNDGTGKFTVHSTVVPAPSKPYLFTAMAVGDLNGDGVPDMVQVGSDSGGTDVVQIYFADGAGNWTLGPSTFVNPRTSTVVIADVDGDGINDIVIGCGFRNGAAGALALIFKNPGNGIFFNPSQVGTTIFPDTPSSAPVQSIVVGDFNRDGRPDVATLGILVVSVFLNQGNFTFSGPTDYLPPSVTGYDRGTYTTPDQYNVLRATDVDGDGTLDLVLSLYGSNSSPQTGWIATFRGNGNGTFKAPTALLGDTFSSFNTTAVAIADFNGDGKQDLVTSNNLRVTGGSEFRFFFGDGLGSFTAQGAIARTANDVTNWGLVAADLNGDGKIDVVLGDSTANSITVYLQK